ncbi:MAG TPA: GntR family transcriptional regulator [Rhabdochlamydiaceae bacterium]|nr:GntR family transcriptional regulator [Rhabdochlamydiaceae bacterium]
MVEKIQRTFVRQEAYLKIRNWILDGTLTPGIQLRDKQLAEQLGVSRTPIREALLRLEDEGLVITKPNRSTLVSTIDFHSAFHLYSIVWTLERLALTQAFGSITDLHIQTMIEANERFLQKMKVRDRLAALDADHDFHSVYVRLSENKELEKVISELKQKLKRLDLYYFDKIKNAALSYEEHGKIVQALKQKDLSLALSAVENNWKNSFSRFKL